MATYEHVGYANITGSVVVYGSGSGDTDLTYSNAGYRQAPGAGNYQSLNLTAVTTAAWFKVRMSAWTGASGTASILTVYDNGGNVLLEASRSPTRGTSGLHFRYRDGGVLVSATKEAFLDLLNTTMFDIEVISDNAGGGRIQVFQEEALILSVTGISNGGLTIDRCELRNWDYTSTSTRDRVGWSEFLVGIGADSPTLGRRVYSKAPTGNSAVNTAWTGAFGDIDEGLITPDALFITSNTAGQRKGFTFPVYTAANGRAETVAIFHTALHNGSGVINHAPSIRLIGVDYDGAAINPTGVQIGYSQQQILNPATGLPWLVTEVAGAEYGFISI